MHVDSLVGRTIDDFVVQERLGRGGMSVVYRAFQPSVSRDIALKIITVNPEMGARDEFSRRFAQEAELIARLEHPNIVPIYDYGTVSNEIAYIAMRLLRGGSLGDLLADGPLPLDRTADLFLQIARGLAYAHKNGIIHRDIKPSNILLDDTGNAYLTDFGLAKLISESLEITREGNIVGTPTYMSPEQLRGDPIDHRADIYSLGVVLYHMVAGRPPFEASESNLISIIYQHLEKEPPPPGEHNDQVSPEVEDVILRALAKSPEDRFDSALDMANALNLALGRAVSTGSFPATRPSNRLIIVRRRNRRNFAIAMGAVLLLAALVLGVAWLSRPAPIPPATILAGEVGVASDAIPTAEEVARAQQRLGDNGFIAYIACNQSSEYHATQAREMGDFATAYGLRYRIYNSDSDRARQIPLIEQARADGAKALLICPLDATALDAALRSAQQAGLPMVMMHSDIPSYGGVLLGGDDYLMGLNAGRYAGQLIRDEMDGEARVVILNYPSLPAIVARTDGIRDGLMEYAPDAEIVAEVTGATIDFGQESVSKLIEDGVEFDVIVSINDAGSFGAINALEAADIEPDEVAIVSVDAEVLAEEYIRDGYFIRGSVDVGREQFSRTAINAMVKLLAGSTLPELFAVPPGEVVTAETLARQDAENGVDIEGARQQPGLRR